MAVAVLWSDEAKRTFAANIEYLQTEWSEKEIRKFILRSEYVVSSLEEYPELYSISNKHKKIRKATINKRISLFYSYRPSKKMVMLLSFWNTYQDDKKRKF